MDHESEYGSVSPCRDLGSGHWPLSLADFGFPGEGQARLPWHEMLVISLSSVQTQALFLLCSGRQIGRQIGKLKACFLEVLSVAFHFQVCLINISDSL